MFGICKIEIEDAYGGGGWDWKSAKPHPKLTMGAVVWVQSSLVKLDKFQFLTADHNGTVSSIIVLNY